MRIKWFFANRLWGNQGVEKNRFVQILRFAQDDSRFVVILSGAKDLLRFLFENNRRWA